VIISDDEDASPVLDAVAPAHAPPSTVGTHLQTAEDLLRSSPLGTFAGANPERVFGMTRAPAPVGLQFPLPMAPDGPLVAEVLLVVDDRETFGAGPSRDAFLARLRVNPGLADKVVRRRLPTGDAVLVARVTTAGHSTVAGAPQAGTEIVLDQLIERKTAADLVASLRDGRMRQQTYYMSATGCKSLTCIVEGDLDAATANDANTRMEAKNLLAELTVTSNFVIKYTVDLTDTAAFFSSLVTIRQRRLGTTIGLSNWLQTNRANGNAAAGTDGHLTFPVWEEAVRTMRQSVTLQQIWALQLNVIPGVGPKRIDRVMDGGFNLPVALQDAYRAAATMNDARTLLARLKPPPGCAPISKELSEFVFTLFTMDEYVRR